MSTFYKILINFLVVGLMLLTIKIASTKYQGYRWMWDTLLHKNYVAIKKNHGLTVDQKHEIKQGAYAKYLNYIKKNTDQDAIILIPPDSVISSLDPKLNFTLDPKLNFNHLKDRRRTTYFLYPRKPVYRKDLQYDANLLTRVTHVAIVDYHGYQELGYKVKKKQKFAVFPVNK